MRREAGYTGDAGDAGDVGDAGDAEGAGEAFARGVCASHSSNDAFPSHLSVFRREWPKATEGRRSWAAQALVAAEGVSAEAGEWVVAEAA